MDETRPFVVSQALSAALGAAWLALVYTQPPPPPTIALLRPEEAAAVEVQFEDEEPEARKADAPKPDTASPDSREPTPAEVAKARKEEQAMADAFGGGTSAIVGDVTNALRGVAVAKGDRTVEGGGKAVIAYGAGGAAARTPGRALEPGVAAAGAGIGRVNAAGSVTRASIAVAAPTIVRAAGAGLSGRDMTRLGTFVRARQAQLQYCYTDVGLPSNPNLAGAVSVTLTLDAMGAVIEANVATRTWSGSGAAETEACILTRVRTWPFPASSKEGVEAYSFSFIFNR